jgi:neurotransmitter:Na+ symporter, NSS family
MTVYHTGFMIITAVIVARGIVADIESASLYFMPVLVALMVTLALYSSAQGDVGAARRLLFRLDRHLITPRWRSRRWAWASTRSTWGWAS